MPRSVTGFATKNEKYFLKELCFGVRVGSLPELLDLIAKKE